MGFLAPVQLLLVSPDAQKFFGALLSQELPTKQFPNEPMCVSLIKC